MSPKERVQRAIRHQSSDIIPYHIDFTSASAEKTARFYGVPSDGLERYIGNHLARVELAEGVVNPGPLNKPDLVQDEFGTIWRKEGHWREIGDWGGIVDFPLKEPDLSGYQFPNPRDPRRFRGLDEFAVSNRDRMVVVTLLGLFDLGWHIRGFENLLCDFACEAKFAEDLLDRCLDFNLGLISEVARHEIDGIRFVEDWGQQKGLIMGPSYWRRFLKPRLKSMYDKVHSFGLPVFIHTCGDVFDIFDDIVDIGVDVINDIQPECMNIFEIKRRWGRHICLFGGVGTQSTLRNGSTQDAKDTALRVMECLGKDGGFIFSSAGAIPGDVPVSNIAALVEVARSQVDKD